MAQMKIDELNTLSEVFDYQDFIDHYFDPMQISEKQRKERKELAEELMDIVLYFLIWCDEFPEQAKTDDVQREFENLYKEKVFGYAEPSTFFDIYIPLFIEQLIDVTLRHQGEEYYTSVERAAVIGCNESNTVIGNKELENAKALGKTKKTWLTELDERVRPTHQDMESVTIPIDDYFVFPDCLMLYPHDEVNGTPDEIVNCRCSLAFS